MRQTNNLGCDLCSIQRTRFAPVYGPLDCTNQSVTQMIGAPTACSSFGGPSVLAADNFKINLILALDHEFDTALPGPCESTCSHVCNVVIITQVFAYRQTSKPYASIVPRDRPIEHDDENKTDARLAAEAHEGTSQSVLCHAQTL